MNRNLHRERALFSGSRLYRTSRETSQFLVSELQRTPLLDEGLHFLNGLGREPLINSDQQLDTLFRELESEFTARLKSVSTYHALPALFQALDDLSFVDQANYKIPLIAMRRPIKSLAMRVGRAFFRGKDGTSSSRKALLTLLKLAVFEDQLWTLRSAYQILPAGRASVKPDGLSVQANLANLLGGFAKAFEPGALVQRLAGKDIGTMISHLMDFSEASIKVMAGESPSSCIAFQDTFWSRLPGMNQTPEYWCAFAARLLLIHFATAVRVQVSENMTEDLTRIAIFEEAVVTRLLEEKVALPQKTWLLLQAEVMNCFWNREWLRSHRPEVLSQEFVTRPATRIAHQKKLFVTSPINIIDSISWISEAAVARYPGFERYHFPDRTFVQLMSEPFERQTVEVFKGLGFIAGSVEKSGVWEARRGIPRSARAAAPQGQIDLLAWHKTGLVVVGECKVLQLPRSTRKMLALWQKVGPDDVEGFRTRLHKNAAWSVDYLRAIDMPVRGLVKVLVLDLPLPFLHGKSDSIYVFDLESLKDGIERILASLQ